MGEGRGKLESLIDFGAMRAVYTARSMADHAIRVLDLSLQDRRNVREARLLEQIHHLNRVNVRGLVAPRRWGCARPLVTDRQ